jgi:hypothetical protein
MLPAGLAAAIGLTAAEIAGFASEATALSELISIAGKGGPAAGVFLRFAREVRKALPGASLADISPRYRAAKFFADQGTYLSGYDPDTIIDRRLAKVISTPSGLGPQGEPVRYWVDVTITFPGTGDTKSFGVWVRSDEFRSARDVMDQAVNELMGQFKPRSKPEEYGGEMGAAWIIPKILSFERFTR